MAVLGPEFPRSNFAREKADPAGRMAGCVASRINGGKRSHFYKGVKRSTKSAV